MSHRLTDEIFASMQAQSRAYQSAFDQGVLIGRREMKPLIRELIEAVEEDPNRTALTMHLIDRAKEALEND